MDDDNKGFIMKLINDLNKIQYVKPEEIPNIDLYMDQVTTFMDKHLESFKRHDQDKLLTKTMINNYTKNNLLPSTDKKKYTKDHMFYMIFIYYMKSIMSITDIQSILNPLSERFFGKQGSIGLEEIYKEVFKMEEEQADRIFKELFGKYNKAMNSFPELDDLEDAKLLRIFMFICLLCFDIYTKKQIIEGIVDNFFNPLKDEAKDKENKEKNNKEKTSKEKTGKDKANREKDKGKDKNNEK